MQKNNQQTLSDKELLKLADKLLANSGYASDGSKKGSQKSRSQVFFERRILMTPMGNKR